MTPKMLISTLALGFMLAVSPAHAAAAWEDFNGNFETGDFSQYLEVQAAPDRATIVKSPVAEGTYAARFERQVGDPLIAGSNRSEAVPDREFGAGETRYFRHLLYLPFESIDWDHFLILCQWHDSSAGPPPLSLQIQTFENDKAKKLLVSSGNQKSIYYEFDIPGSAQWFELVYRITFGAKGSMEVWLDGKSLGEVTDIDTIGTEPTNWKLGNYRSSEAVGTTVLYQDGVMVTKSFFSDPPNDPAEDAAEDVAAAPVAGPPAPLPAGGPKSPDARPCQRAKLNLSKARARLNVARQRFSDSGSQAQRRRLAKRVSQNAKSYRQAKQRVRRLCQGGVST